MKKTTAAITVAVFALSLSGTAFARGGTRALWIEINKESKGKTTIAVTEDVVRALLESNNDEWHFKKEKGRKEDLITRQMVLDVLNGDKESVKVRDDDEGETAHLYMDDLDVPRHTTNGNHVVLETFKDGKKTFRMSLGDFNIEKTDDDGNGESFFLNWQKLLPFVKHDGGAVYINTEQDDTVVWLFME